MMNQIEPFLHPYQLQHLKNKINKLIQTFYFIGDNRVLEATRDALQKEIEDLVNPQSQEQMDLLLGATKVRDKEEMSLFFSQLEPYIIPFPTLTADDIKKLFPKVKKILQPDLSEVNLKKLTYLGWRDISANRLYIIHQENGTLVGTVCNYVLSSRSNICAWCNQMRNSNQIGLVTAQAKKRHPDDYKVAGMHICLDSSQCNQGLTNTQGIQKFFDQLRH